MKDINISENIIDEKFNTTAVDISKLLITLSTGIIVISLTFFKDYLKEVSIQKYYLNSGWIFEIISVITGIFFLLSMLIFYYNWEKVKLLYKPALYLGLAQLVCFLLGTIFIVYFAILNLK
jgi:hypothetical protein